MITSPTGLHNPSLDSEDLLHLSSDVGLMRARVDERIGSSHLRKRATRWLCNAYGSLEAGVDLLAVICSVFLADYVYRQLHIGRSVHYHLSDVAAAACFAGFCFVLVLKANGAYTRAMSLLRVRETERVISASVKLCFLAFAVTFWSAVQVSRWVVLLAAITVPVMVFAEKHMIHLLVRLSYAHGYAARRAIIYGAGLSGQRVFSVLARSPKLGLEPIAIVDDDASQVGSQIHEAAYAASRFIRVSAGPITAKLLQELSAEVVIISSPSISAEKFEQISVETARANATLSFVPHDTITSNSPLSYWDADGLIFASASEHELIGIYELTKRSFDFAVALLLLVVLSPLLILIAVAIRLTSAGPALFVQNRVGKNGKLFQIFKFRSMHIASPRYAYSPITLLDPRITKIGAFLRRTSLDELPQLLNILKGEMSLVGPRPEMPFIVKHYDELQRQRLSVRPGITGLWQLSADRAHQIHENIQYDLYYIRHCSFFMDLAILLHTLGFAMRGI